jgi:hypothetical protein
VTRRFMRLAAGVAFAFAAFTFITFAFALFEFETPVFVFAVLLTFVALPFAFAFVAFALLDFVAFVLAVLVASLTFVPLAIATIAFAAFGYASFTALVELLAKRCNKRARRISLLLSDMYKHVYARGDNKRDIRKKNWQHFAPNKFTKYGGYEIFELFIYRKKRKSW